MGLFDLFKKKEPKVSVSISTHEYTPEEINQQFEQERKEREEEIKELAKVSFPSKNGLHPNEILVLSRAERVNAPKTITVVPYNFAHSIGCDQEILDMLLARGFIKVTTAKESVVKLKVAELKEILSEHGIKPTGKKADLIVSVQENISEDDLTEKIPARRYVLTELGEQELKENEYVTYFGYSKKYGLTVWDMNRMVQDYPCKLFRDKIWAHLNQKVYESTKSLQNDGDLYSFYLREVSINYEMCDFLLEENNRQMDALRCWSRGFYHDLLVKSAASYKMTLANEKYREGPTMKRVRDPNTGESILIEDNSPPQFKDDLFLEFRARNVRAIQEQLRLSDDQLFQKLRVFFHECQPISYERIQNRNITRLNLSCEDMAGLVVSEVNGNEKSADAIYKSIESQIKQDKTPVWKK